MADKWYFAQVGVEFGPYSAARMMELAAGGTLRRAAVVWKEGMTRRVAASKVDKLFPHAQLPFREAAAPADRSSPPAVGGLSPSAPAGTAGATTHPTPPDATAIPLAATGSADSSPVLRADSGVRTGGEAVPSPKQPIARHEPVKKKRVMGMKGAVVTSQDGVTVTFKKKCLQCGYEDSSRNTMPIRNGPMRAQFFCPKCRKAQPVEMQGVPT